MKRSSLLFALLAIMTMACVLPATIADQPTANRFKQPVGSSTEVSVPTSARTTQVTAVQALNVRSGNGVSFRVTATLLAGVTVEVVGECDSGWVIIRAGDVTGWVNADYLGGAVC